MAVKPFLLVGFKMQQKEAKEVLNLFVFSALFFAICNLIHTFFILDGNTFLILLIVYLILLYVVKKRNVYIDVLSL